MFVASPRAPQRTEAAVLPAAPLPPATLTQQDAQAGRVQQDFCSVRIQCDASKVCPQTPPCPTGWYE